jgi:hypothetical protein
VWLLGKLVCRWTRTNASGAQILDPSFHHSVCVKSLLPPGAGDKQTASASSNPVVCGAGPLALWQQSLRLGTPTEMLHSYNRRASSLYHCRWSTTLACTVADGRRLYFVLLQELVSNGVDRECRYPRVAMKSHKRAGAIHSSCVADTWNNAGRVVKASNNGGSQEIASAAEGRVILWIAVGVVSSAHTTVPRACRRLLRRASERTARGQYGRRTGSTTVRGEQPALPCVSQITIGWNGDYFGPFYYPIDGVLGSAVYESPHARVLDKHYWEDDPLHLFRQLISRPTNAMLISPPLFNRREEKRCQWFLLRHRTDATRCDVI